MADCCLQLTCEVWWYAWIWQILMPHVLHKAYFWCCANFLINCHRLQWRLLTANLQTAHNFSSYNNAGNIVAVEGDFILMNYEWWFYTCELWMASRFIWLMNCVEVWLVWYDSVAARTPDCMCASVCLLCLFYTANHWRWARHVVDYIACLPFCQLQMS